MNNSNLKKRFYFIASCLTLMIAFATAIAAQGNSFTYQGKLNVNGAAATGSYEMRFSLFTQSDKGLEVGTPQTISNVAVTNGIFTVKIPFSDWTFDDNPRFMKIEIRPQGNPNPFTALAPLQEFTQSPKALYSSLSGIAEFSNSSAFATNSLKLNGLDADRYVLKNTNGEIVAPRFENSATDPVPASAANAGQVYFNTTTKSVMFSDGTTWRSLSPPRQTFTGTSGFTQFSCATPTAIRSVNFTKSSATSRLRITYKDTAGASSPVQSYIFVVGKIDNLTITNPTRLQMYFQTFAESGFFSLRNSFTLIGYANNVAAGNHTLSFGYEYGVGVPSCFRSDEPFFIEIEEVP